VSFYSVYGGGLSGSTIKGHATLTYSISVVLEGGTEGVDVRGNSIYDSVTTGIYISLFSKNNTIHGNTITNAAGAGISIDGYALGHGGNIVTGNVISGQGGGSGVLLANTTDNNIISGNIIRNQYYGVLRGSGTNTGNSIQGNIITGTSVNHFSTGTAIDSGFTASGRFRMEDGGGVGLTANDATPSVLYGFSFITANTAPTTITNFDNGLPGQWIWIDVNDANTTIDFTSSNLFGNGGADLTAQAGDSLLCFYDGYQWRCFVSLIH
jgi:hypothetical protein